MYSMISGSIPRARKSAKVSRLFEHFGLWYIAICAIVSFLNCVNRTAAALPRYEVPEPVSSENSLAIFRKNRLIFALTELT